MANSISSTLLGWNNRRLQAQAHEKNQEFQLEMERARHITDDERMQEEIAFKRRLVALSREQRQEAARKSFNAQMQAIELRHYLQYCWPLDPLLPQTILQEIRSGTDATNPRLNVILMHAPLLPLRAYGTDANEQDAVKVLEFSVSTGSDALGSYTLLSKLYKNLGTPEKITDLKEKAAGLNSLTAPSIIRMLEKQ